MAKTALSKRPTRLSPGVYRGPGGELTNRAGKPLGGGRRPSSNVPPQGALAPEMPMPTGAMDRSAAPVELGYQEQPYLDSPNAFQQGFGGAASGIGAGLVGANKYTYGSPTDAPSLPPSQQLQDVARQRAEAMSRGEMVTMDYNPQREALVEQYLNEMRGGQVYAPGSPDMTRTGIAYQNPFGGNIYDGYQQQRLQQDAMSGARGGFGVGIGAPAPMAFPTQSVTGGMPQGVAAGLGGGPMRRPPAPMRPRGDGRDRRFPQPQVRPLAPLPPSAPAGQISTPQRPQRLSGFLRRGR